MDAKRRAKWSELRAKGQGRFLLVEGILKTGGMFAVLTLVVRYLRKNGFTNSQLAAYLSSGETILRFIFDWLFFGYFMGLLLWYMGGIVSEKAGKRDDKAEDSKPREA